MEQRDSLEVLFKNMLVQDLDKEALTAFFSTGTRLTLEPGEYLMREGDASEEIFFILDGSLEITKRDSSLGGNFVLGMLFANDTVGEIAFLDHGKRTASVQAITRSHLISTSARQLRQLIKTKSEFQEIFFRVSEKICQRLRQSNEFAITALSREVDQFKIRTQIGSLFIYVSASFSFLLLTFPTLSRLRVDNSYIISTIITTLFLLLYTLVRSSKLRWYDLGVNLTNWRQSLFEGGLCMFCLLFFLGWIIKWFLIHYNSHYFGRDIIEPFVATSNPDHSTWGHWILMNSLYAIFLVPMQELVARGLLQGLLEKFLIGRHLVLKSIILSNLIFSSWHMVFFPTHISISIFVFGCCIGWLYSRTHSLLSPSLAHIWGGILLFSIFGITK